MTVLFALLLAAVWGAIWALVLEFVPLGRFLAQRRTWLTVIVGVGGDLAILCLIVPWQMVVLITGVFACSAVGIIVRSLYNEYRETQELLHGVKDPARQ